MADKSQRLPSQNMETVLLHADRFYRASEALQDWAETAKKCVEYFEDKQWSDEDAQKLKDERRPALTINKIKPLVMLVQGYHANNRTDIKYLPGHDGSGSAEIADVMSHVSKQIGQMNQLQYLDAEVYLDGLLTGRGYCDVRLNFEDNDFGEVSYTPVDNFSVYLDPEAEHYDLNKGNFVLTSRMISLDEVEYYYGRDASAMVSPLIGGYTHQGSNFFLEHAEEIHPWRRFGGEQDDVDHQWRSNGAYFYDWVDKARKTVRMLDIQHYVRTYRHFFVDLETGDRKVIPDHWSPQRIKKVMDWAQSQGQPIVVQKRLTRRVRWTHMIGDIIVYDQWSPYSSFTIVPFFPYFRRGRTKGMVESLLGPQDEINKRRSARMNYIGRMSNGGWLIDKGALDAQNKAQLERHGSTPGVIIEWNSHNNSRAKPEQIMPGQDNAGQAVLEQEAEDDLRNISGINQSALGEIDKVQSGRAIEARQRQTIVGLEPFMMNYSRYKELQGRKQLELIQNFYTEERVVRTVGGDGADTTMTINKRGAEGIMNDVTVGKYAVSIDEAPLSKTFLEAQFEELLRLKELNVPIPDEYVIEASSLGRKDELKQELAQARRAQQAMAQQGGDPNSGQAAGPGPGGSQLGEYGESLPPGEPGQPVAAE